MNPRDLDFAYLKRVVPVEQVLACRGLLAGLRSRGALLVGPCPVHGGDNPRAFVLDRRKGVWNCFTGCRAGGDVIELVRRLDGCTSREAALYLATLVGAPPPPLPPPAPQRDLPFRPFARRLQLDPHHPLLHAKGIRPEVARRYEVGAWNGGGMLRRCVAVRLLDPRGQPLGYAGRRLDPDEARQRGKWVFPPRLPKRSLLYGFAQTASQLDRGLVVVECPWGVLRLQQIGIPAVALLGTRLSIPQRELLRQAPRVVLMLDGDLAGRTATLDLHSDLAPVTRVLRADLPDGLDPDDLDDEHLDQILSPLLPS